MSDNGKGVSTKDYKDRGEKCLEEEKYLEAVLNFTFAIKHDLRNADLYSKRSLAFLKTQQYYFALKDAEQVIKLQPKRHNGLLAKADVLFAAQQYKAAMKIYKEILNHQPDDNKIMDKMAQSLKELTTIEKQMQQLPWLGSAIGLLIGIAAVVFQYISKAEVLKNPVLQAFIILLFGLGGYGVAVYIRKVMNSYRASLLDKPLDLFGNNAGDDE